jgi:hypothetical protein
VSVGALTMDAKLVSFGEIEIEGRRFTHDVVVEDGQVRKRRKGPSKVHRARYGHTPVSAEEAIPWSAARLVIGTGASGQLPVMDEVFAEAKRRSVEIVAVPTREACELLVREDEPATAAILHVTC